MQRTAIDLAEQHGQICRMLALQVWSGNLDISGRLWGQDNNHHNTKTSFASLNYLSVTDYSRVSK